MSSTSPTDNQGRPRPPRVRIIQRTHWKLYTAGPIQKAQEGDEWGEKVTIRPYKDPDSGTFKEYHSREDAIADRERLNVQKPEGADRFVLVKVVVTEEVDEPLLPSWWPGPPDQGK